jgi:hypothetical protein
MVGAVYHGVQAVRGGEGMLTGSVSYAVEILEASTSRLLCGYVTRQYPGAYNVGATARTLPASRGEGAGYGRPGRETRCYPACIKSVPGLPCRRGPCSGGRATWPSVARAGRRPRI